MQHTVRELPDPRWKSPEYPPGSTCSLPLSPTPRTLTMDLHVAPDSEVDADQDDGAHAVLSSKTWTRARGSPKEIDP